MTTAELRADYRSELRVFLTGLQEFSDSLSQDIERARGRGFVQLAIDLARMRRLTKDAMRSTAWFADAIRVGSQAALTPSPRFINGRSREHRTA